MDLITFSLLKDPHLMHRKVEIREFLSDQHEANTQHSTGNSPSGKICNSHKQTWGFSGFGTKQKGRQSLIRQKGEYLSQKEGNTCFQTREKLQGY